MPKITVDIDANASELKKQIAEAEIELKGLRKEMQRKFSLGEVDAAKKIQLEVNQAKTSLKSLQSEFRNVTPAVNGMTKSVGNGGNTLMQFSRIAQDAPFGIMGIGNNITATAEAFSHLSKSSGGAGNALKAVAGSMLGTGGILLAVSLITTALTYMSQNGITMADVFDKLIGKAKDLKAENISKAFESEEVIKVSQNVSDLTNKVQLAKDGFIDKNDVIKEYNKTMGKTTGIVSTLDGVEQSLVKNGAAYVEMTMLKAAADMARQEASKKSLEAASNEVKALEKFVGVWDIVKASFKGGGSLTGLGANLYSIALGNKKAAIQESKDFSKEQLSIADNLMKKAAEISKKYNFNLLGNNEEGKKVKKEQYKNPKGKQSFGGGFIGGGLVNPSLGLVTPNLGIDEAAVEANAKLAAGLRMQEDTLNKFNQNVSEIIENSLVDTFGNLGTVIGDALASGGNVLQAAGNSLLQGLSGLLSAMGGKLIELGTAAVLAGTVTKLFGTITGIGAGIAAIAGGVVLKGIASGIVNKGGGVGGSSSNSGGNSYQTSGGNNGGFSSNSGGGTVVFEISGQKLIGVLSNTTEANKRLGGANYI